ncbi:AB hydrolase superfamily protein B1A11.02 [Cladobotryum mycophilum]|uniref:AB hydrolase superfamily protein B1A11.02 n=1 Tax=Cladobotryum mycophilum TaxID=491253 RepID=A0ABR0SX58_9HYPO
MAEYTKFSKISPEWESFVKSQPTLSKFRTSDDHIIERRAAFQQLAAEGPQLRRIPSNDEVIVHDFKIRARDGYDIPVRSYFPRELEGSKLPLFVYYHGGGWTFGDIETGDDNCRLLCGGNKLCVLNIDYRLAPKHVFPTGINDAYDAFKWAAEKAETLSADPAKGFIVGGVSAGGNMAGVIAYLARDDKIEPPITGLFLSIPCCLMPQAFHLAPQWKDELLSIELNKNSDMLDVRSYNQLIQDILKAPPEDPRISFLLFPDHSNLPTRAYFQIAGLDPIRDEAVLFSRLLREHSGAKTLVHMYDGLPHGFWRFQQLPTAQKWADDLFEGTDFLLHGGKDGFVVKPSESENPELVVNGLDEYISGII